MVPVQYCCSRGARSAFDQSLDRDEQAEKTNIKQPKGMFQMCTRIDLPAFCAFWNAAAVAGTA
jgi:hypothetical protein